MECTMATMVLSSSRHVHQHKKLNTNTSCLLSLICRHASLLHAMLPSIPTQISCTRFVNKQIQTTATE